MTLSKSYLRFTLMILKITKKENTLFSLNIFPNSTTPNKLDEFIIMKLKSLPKIIPSKCIFKICAEEIT